MTYESLSLLSFAELLDRIDRYKWGVSHLPASVDLDDWAQEARIAAWTLTAGGTVPAEFAAVARAAHAAIRPHYADAMSHASSCSIRSLIDGEDRPDAEYPAFGTSPSAEAEAIAREIMLTVCRKKRNYNGVPSCRFRTPPKRIRYRK
jgi:hypothetical protein